MVYLSITNHYQKTIPSPAVHPLQADPLHLWGQEDPIKQYYDSSRRGHPPLRTVGPFSPGVPGRPSVPAAPYTVVIATIIVNANMLLTADYVSYRISRSTR